MRQELQALIDVHLPNATNLTDGQKQVLLGDAFFLLIGLTLAENVWQTSSQNQTGTIIGVDMLKQKFFEPLRSVANHFTVPREQLITGLIVSMLLKLSGNDQNVSYFFNEWQKYFERIKNDPDFLKANIQLQIENEDDLKVAKNLALLYGRKERNLPPKALKLLFQIYNSPVFSHAIALNPKEKIVRGLISLVLSMERRSRMHDEAKVPKELL